MYILPKDFLDFSFGMTEKGTKKGSARHFCTDKAFTVGVYRHTKNKSGEIARIRSRPAATY